MSWLSAALKRNHLDVLNQIAKPVQAVVNPIVNDIPVIGGIKQGIEAVGNYIPPVNGKTAQAAAGAITGQPGQNGAPSAVPSFLSFLTGNGGKNALGVAQGVNAALLQQKANEYAKNALGMATSAYDAKAPIRAAGLQNIQHVLGQPAPSLSPLSQIASNNPFAPRS